YRSGARVARQFTSSIDSDDLVSEAYTRIYQRVLAGGGPTGAFRPYLYTTIRNLASTWGAAARHVQVDDISDFEDPQTSADPVAIALDRTLTARAFRSLPERWQSVLWYTEVEGMDPHEVAPLLGLTANGVAALSYRAREGLRKAWLQAHVNDASASGECRWAISRLGDNARHGLSARDSDRIMFHLATCAKCSIINEEIDEVGSRLALVMIPLLLGGVVGGALLASFGGAASSAMAATAIPAAPTIAGVAVAAAGTGLGAATVPVAAIGILAIAVAIGGAIAVVNPAITSPISSQTEAHSASANDDGDTEVAAAQKSPGREAGADHPANIIPPGASTVVDAAGNVVNGVASGVGTAVDGVASGVGQVAGGVVGGVVDPLLGTVVADPVAADVTLSGHGVPGATVTATVAGTVYASTKITSNGSFSLAVSAPAGSTVQLTQVLGGPLGSILSVPLSLDGGVAGLVVRLLN
ncbi:MAG: sigma-70 family RNA polymerase sigma factor, partial [Rhodoglobus sp.]